MGGTRSSATQGPKGEAGSSHSARTPDASESLSPAHTNPIWQTFALALPRGRPGTGESLERLRSVGQPLPEPVHEHMQEGLGHDFSQVRVHTDARAAAASQALGARAFAYGAQIFFGAGQWSPNAPGGQRLLAHELAHVIEQGRARPLAGVGAKTLPAVHPAPRIQRDATNQTISPGYAQGLDDGSLLAQIELVEAALRDHERDPALVSSLGENLQILRDEYWERDPGTSAVSWPPASIPALEPGATIPEGGEDVGRIGIVAWDGETQLRLRESPDTSVDNVVTRLPFSTHIQIIKRFPGDWYFVSTSTGELGYVASMYIWTDLPEPNARLHRVASGIPGTAIAIAERYYGEYADDWGQDLRFYVNVLAWANDVAVPNTTAGWRDTHFQAGQLIWVPSQPFARSLKGVINSGSYSYNAAEWLGVADFIERMGELWADFRRAIQLSGQYMGEAISRHVEEALWNVLRSLALMLVAAVLILAISTAVGAAIGAIAGGGVGAAPGAAAGFEIGMVILEWLGLAFLITWIAQALWETGRAFATFLGSVWNARGDERVLDRAAQELAEAVGILLGNLVEALVMYAASVGINQGVGALRNTRIGRSMGETRSGEWLSERMRRVQAGEARLARPRDVYARIVRGVEIVDANGSPIGEFDGVSLREGRFIENKAASGLSRVNPRTGQPQQTPVQWAQRQITGKTRTRIRNLGRASATRPTVNGSATVPTLAEIQGIRHVHFAIDGTAPALRAAVFGELAALRGEFPGWTFTAEFGVTLPIVPVPDLSTEE